MNDDNNDHDQEHQSEDESGGHKNNLEHGQNDRVGLDIALTKDNMDHKDENNKSTNDDDNDTRMELDKVSEQISEIDLNIANNKGDIAEWE